MLKLKTVCAACCLSLLLCALPCYAAPLLDTSTGPEKMYTLSEQELTTLEQNSNELARINEELRRTCNGQQIKAAELQVKLTKAEELSKTLQRQLTDLQAKSTRQEALLTQANESLKESAKEEKRTRLRVKAQRNTWEAVAGAMLIGMIAK